MCLHMGASYIGMSVCVYMSRPLVWGVMIVIARPCAIYRWSDVACVCVCVSLLVVEWWVIPTGYAFGARLPVYRLGNARADTGIFYLNY